MPLKENILDVVQYPYYGSFYKVGVDESLPLNEQKAIETLVFETVCDIQRTAKLHNGNLLGANYTVYFPLEDNPDATGDIDRYKPIKVRRGMTFRGKFYGYTVEGQVEIIRPSQLGGCSCDIKIVSETDPTDDEEETDADEGVENA
jgi:hypothetical protein